MSAIHTHKQQLEHPSATDEWGLVLGAWTRWHPHHDSYHLGMTDDDDMTRQQSMSPIMSLQCSKVAGPGACLRCDYPCCLKHAAVWPRVARQLIDVPAVYDDQTLRGSSAEPRPPRHTHAGHNQGDTQHSVLACRIGYWTVKLRRSVSNNQQSMVADDLGVSETWSTDFIIYIIFAMNVYYMKGVDYWTL